MTDRKMPTPEEIQKEFEDFVRNRFGNDVQVFAQPMQVQPEQPEEPSGGDESAAHDDHDEDESLKFRYKPKEIKEYLDRFVIKQDDAKKALTIAVCDHYNHVHASEEDEWEYSKQNVLILGPTGVGKTYLIRRIAHLIGVPFVKADATRFSETGYVGSNVDDLIRDLVTQADGDIEKAQYGIVYLDEADKLASSPDQGGRDVSGRGVQFGLLKLMEETEVDLSSGNDMRSQLQAFMEYQRKGKVDKKLINTRNILFIVSGAFNGLDELVKKRLNQTGIGFNASLNRMDPEADFLPHASTQDFVDYGFEPEFVGRLPVRVSCHTLSVDDLFHILKESEGSIVRQYEDSFAAYGIRIIFSDDALRRIAEMAHAEKTGARALMTIFERILRDFKFELPSTDIQEFVVTPEVVDDPRGELDRLLADPSYNRQLTRKVRLREFECEYSRNYGISLRFSEEAAKRLCAVAEEKNVDTKAFCRELLSSYEHGLKLVRQTSGRREFVLPERVVDEPDAVLEQFIRESYAAADKEVPGSTEGSHPSNSDDDA